MPPVKRTIVAQLPFNAAGKNLELLKFLTNFGKEFGYINSRNSKIKNTNTVIKPKKGDEYTIEFTIEALDGGQQYINKIKGNDLINELNQIKKLNLVSEKYGSDVLSKLKFKKTGSKPKRSGPKRNKTRHKHSGSKRGGTKRRQKGRRCLPHSRMPESSPACAELRRWAKSKRSKTRHKRSGPKRNKTRHKHNKTRHKRRSRRGGI